jgi:uncharacterized protein
MASSVITRELIWRVRVRFALDWRGVHGPRHWARVRTNGLKLASTTGANRQVVELFALLHDSCRESELDDPEHGSRAALFAEELNTVVFHLEPEELSALVDACRRHSDGSCDSNITVETCWDADRLDLGRVGIKPDPRRLCTTAAREPQIVEWAYERSIREFRRWSTWVGKL